MPLTAEQRSLSASVAANTGVAVRGGKVIAANARRGFDQKFLREARELNPDLHDEVELHRRADALKNAHMKRLALRSSKARAARKAKAT